MEVVKQRVLNEISLDSRLRAMPVQVDYSKGLIILKGRVKSFHQLQCVVEAAKRVIENRSKFGNGIPYFNLTLKNDVEVNELC